MFPNAITLLVIVGLVVSPFVHWKLTHYLAASTVAAFVSLALTKLMQLAYFGYLHPLFILSLPGELAVTFAIALFVGVFFWLHRNRDA